MGKHESVTYGDAMEQAVGYNKWILEQYSGFIVGDILEVGIGHGGFLGLLQGIKSYTGVDIDENLINSAQEKNPAAEYIQADVSRRDFLDKVGNRKFNTIICLNVLEHIEKDVQTIEHLSKLLKEDGNLLIFVPAFSVLYNDLDRLAGHVRRYSRKSMVEVLTKAGCRAIKLDYFNAVGAIGWWINKWIHHDSLNSGSVSNQVAFFEKFVLPFSKLLNPVTKNLFGQSLVCVIRRKN